MYDSSATHYRIVVGALLYASVATRQYITCRFVSEPIDVYMEDAKSCVRYLQPSTCKVITFGG
jgi:hypothetical protein